METKRQHKYAKQLLKDLADIFQRDMQGSFKNAFVTLTDVEISPDLAIASIYVSVLPVQNGEAVMEVIGHNSKRIRGTLGRLIGKQARIVPELRFFLDQTEENASKMDALINSLDIPEEEEPEE
ncbi:MAG: 30S ribosome-binding factor RbfA [Cyclobacteriaceae bacterium]|nr:30S ribosome-binding factor RbfA [Cyclobacteriaceae bacterium]